MPRSDPLQLMLVAGEASGDRYAADLVAELRRRHPDWRYCGMGSVTSREANIEVLADSTRLAVVGLIEVLRHYPEIHAAMRMLRAALRVRRPDLLILIDYPEFNLRLARFARALGIPTLFYVSPQLWAWRAGRVRKIRRHISHMAVILPFEEEFYRQHGVPVTYTGHPLSGCAQAREEADVLRERWQLDAERPVIGLFPGSRLSELDQLLPVCVEAVQELRNHPSAPQFVLAAAPGIEAEEYAARLPQDSPIHYIRDDIYNTMSVCTMAMAASGTITLQLALMRVPFCMMYRMSPLTYAAARALVRIKHYCLPNIITGQALVPELIQSQANGAAVAEVLRSWLERSESLEAVRTQLQTVQERLGPSLGMTRLADCVEELLEKSETTA